VDRLLGEVGIVVATADDLATEHPEVVAVAGERFVSQSMLQQIDQEGLDELDDTLADGDIVWLICPGLGPVCQVRAELLKDSGCGWGDNRAVIDSPTLGCHAAHPLAQRLSSLPRLCL